MCTASIVVPRITSIIQVASATFVAVPFGPVVRSAFLTIAVPTSAAGS